MCFREREPRRWTASFGTLLRPPKQRKYVRRIIIHEKYDGFVPDHEYDIALVELASSIEFTSDVHSVCLPEASYILRDNTSCFVSGWGALKNDGECLFTPCGGFLAPHASKKTAVDFMIFICFALVDLVCWSCFDQWFGIWEKLLQDSFIGLRAAFLLLYALK